MICNMLHITCIYDIYIYIYIFAHFFVWEVACFACCMLCFALHAFAFPPAILATCIEFLQLNGTQVFDAYG